jgi:large subunit ribosomal protein L32
MVTACPQCGSGKRPHRVCPTCGFYAGKKAIEVDVA